LSLPDALPIWQRLLDAGGHRAQLAAAVPQQRRRHLHRKPLHPARPARGRPGDAQQPVQAGGWRRRFRPRHLRGRRQRKELTMTSEPQKALLKDLLDQERISDILQTMLTIARTESLRLEATAGDLRRRNTILANPELFDQAALAARRASTRMHVLVSATRQATAREMGAGVPHTTMFPAGGPVQQALLKYRRAKDRSK